MNKLSECQLCKKVFKYQDLNKVRFEYDIVLLCDKCIKYTHFNEYKKDDKTPIDVIIQSPI
jgi:hypothetical protein